ncbi:hypothetical protein [Bradyrhizobium sp. STM 3843]|uniref:hypothetical protein n=1 Tax=Bradyrhizobium sp. STM 3843 TaxID=551947 RepID=UPI001AEBB835|nr:hypothetical protein [Bradyrhizobium sp. STM 3843]
MLQQGCLLDEQHHPTRKFDKSEHRHVEFHALQADDDARRNPNNVNYQAAGAMRLRLSFSMLLTAH